MSAESTKDRETVAAKRSSAAAFESGGPVAAGGQESAPEIRRTASPMIGEPAPTAEPEPISS
eukprot:scaffold55367_cov32-Tisochrysis_lutea.AAC.2